MLGSGGVVKLLDFGVAHEMAQLPAPDACQSGTLAYMSPDQLLGDALGPASDIFSLGVVFYEMHTNRLPHAGTRSEEHTSELQSLAYLVCRLLLEKKKKSNVGTSAETSP